MPPGGSRRPRRAFARSLLRTRTVPRRGMALEKATSRWRGNHSHSYRRLRPGSEWEALIVADVWVSAGRFEQALTLYRDVQRLHPGVPGVHRSVATLYELAGKPEWADVERQREPARPASCAKTAADCEFLAGRYLEALGAAGTRQEPVSLYWRIRALNALATDAFATLDRLPPSAEVHMVRAAIDRDQGRAVDAVPELKAALALRPGDRQIEEELAAALYEAKNLEEALPLLARFAGPSAKAEARTGVLLRRRAAAGATGRSGAPLFEGSGRQAGPTPLPCAPRSGARCLHVGRCRRRAPSSGGRRGQADDPESDGASALPACAGVSAAGPQGPRRSWR